MWKHLRHDKKLRLKVEIFEDVFHFFHIVTFPAKTKMQKVFRILSYGINI